MKTRKGWVANSSTSCFICDVCGTMEGGMDMDLSDFDMSECENGHTVCDSHKLESVALTIEQIRDIMVVDLKSFVKTWTASTYEWAKKWETQYREQLELVTSLQGNELVSYFEDDDGLDWYVKYRDENGFSEKECPICQFKIGTDKDLASFALSELGWTREFAIATMGKTWQSYTDFRQAMKGK